MTTDDVITRLEIESERQRQVKFLNVLLMSVTGLHGLGLLYGILSAIREREILVPIRAWQNSLLIGLILVYTALFYLNRRGKTRLAAHLTCSVFTLEFFAFIVANLFEGESSAAAAAIMATIMILAVLIAGMVISRRAIIWFAALDTVLISMAFLLILGTERLGLTISIVCLLLLIAVISWLYQKTVEESHHALLKTRLQKEAELEQLVAARTHRLETVATLSGRLIAILDFDQLLIELVSQIKERFGYYHVHIYILDEGQQSLVMNAGAGEAGAAMKVAGHSIPLDAMTSLVVRAARSGEIVRVDNVREAKDWLPNPLLPDTCTEMAVPIVREGKVVGVLDVQEDEIAGLDEGDANMLHSLASHVAVALTNAQLYQTEKELRRAEAERVRELAKLNVDLKAAQAELLRQERLATLGQLTAIVSHEIRNPLATIRASAFTVDQKTRDKGLGLEPVLDRIQRNITRCDNIISELLDYTRMPDLYPQLIHIDHWLHQVLDEQTLPEGVTLSQELTAGVEISLDPERFRRVIINLVDNAYQAMLEWKQSNDKPLVLSIRSKVVDQQLRISISDTGPGIPPDVLPHIFDPLYSTKGFGVGLGLPIVKEIINQHSGKIEITSEIGKGTQAILWLPLLQSERDKG